MGFPPFQTNASHRYRGDIIKDKRPLLFISESDGCIVSCFE